MRLTIAIPLALHLCIAVDSLTVSASAQAPATPTDSVSKDSAGRDTVPTDSLPQDAFYRGSIHPPLLNPLVFAVVSITFVVFPAPFAAWLGKEGPTEMEFLEDHLAVYATVGGSLQKGQTGAHSVNAEILRKGMHGELQLEDFWRPRYVRYLTVRGGYLWHPRRHAAGGVTVGYVHANREPGQRGVEIGVPLLVGNRTRTFRVAPMYLLSPKGAFWNYRVQLELLIPGGPYFAGLNAVGKSMPLRRSVPAVFPSSALTLLFGARF